IPESNQLWVLRWAVVSLPDENRVVLQALLYFLNNLAKHSSVTQMTAESLSICFSPSLFHFAHRAPSAYPVSGDSSTAICGARISRDSSNNFRNTFHGFSSKRSFKPSSLNTIGAAEPKEVIEQRASQNCLTALIRHAPTLFQ
ncbi:Dynein light chain Tctex-type, partial [Cichlidogyrus casuarinus]